MKNQLSLAEAKRLSIIKWELIVENNGSPEIDYPEEVSVLIHDCGFCERWRPHKSGCEKCECAKVLGGACNSMGGRDLFAIWSKNQTKENAQAVLDAIKSINTTEYKWYDIRKYFNK